MDFADFYASARDDCLRAVFASVGDRQEAEEVVAEAFGIYLAIQSGSNSQGWGWGLDLVQATQACTG